MDKYGDYKFYDIQDIYNDIGEDIPNELLDKIKKVCDDYFDDKEFRDKTKKEMLINLYNNQDNVKDIYDETNKKTLIL